MERRFIKYKRLILLQIPANTLYSAACSSQEHVRLVLLMVATSTLSQRVKMATRPFLNKLGPQLLETSSLL